MLLIGASRGAMMIIGQLGWLHTFISHGWVFARTRGSVHSFTALMSGAMNAYLISFVNVQSPTLPCGKGGVW